MVSSHYHRILSAILMAGLLTLAGCSDKSAKSSATTRIITATPSQSETRLFYAGAINPLHVDNVVSPVDGVVQNLEFVYGDGVQENQFLMTIISSKSQDDYHSALTNYIKARDTYENNKTEFAGTTALYKAKVVSREQFINERSQLETNELALINALIALRDAAKNIPDAYKNIQALSLRDINTVRSILEKQADLIKIYSPAPGVILSAIKPPQGGGGGDDSNKAVGAGSSVKQGQVIASIGHMIGISMPIAIPSVDVNKVHAGQQVIVTSSALPGMMMHGVVANVSKQAQSSDSGGGGGLPTFASEVIVPRITEHERSLIKIGMDTKVEIIIKGTPQIHLPINAIFRKNGVSMVSILDAKTKKIKDVPVTTGQTDLTSVTIVSGIKSGDKVVVHD